MTVITNNMTKGCIDGIGNSCGSGFVPAGVTNIGQGNPDNVVTAQTGSDIFWDAVGGEFYIEESGIGGSQWRALS